MTLAAKRDRKYFGLVHMDMPDPFTPYHAYAMLQSAFEDKALDPKDFKSKPVSSLLGKLGKFNPRLNNRPLLDEPLGLDEGFFDGRSSACCGQKY